MATVEEEYLPYVAGGAIAISAAIATFALLEKTGLGQAIAAELESLLHFGGAGGGGPGGGGQTYTVEIIPVDQNGVPIPNAAVTLGTAGAVSDSSGAASFYGIGAGNYTVSITALGFQPFESSVSVAPTTTFTLGLTPVAVCQPLACPPGQTWVGEPTCACVPQVPASLSAPATYVFSENWDVGATLFGQVAAQVEPRSSCQSGITFADIGVFGDTFTFPVTVQVKDDKGNPVAGVTIDATLSESLSDPVAVKISNILGSCTMSAQFAFAVQNPTTTTDDQGNASFSVSVTITNVVNNGCGCASVFSTPCSSGTAFQNIPLLVTMNAPGTSLPSATTAVTMQAQICGFGFS